jgi:hypothetical protein
VEHAILHMDEYNDDCPFIPHPDGMERWLTPPSAAAHLHGRPISGKVSEISFRGKKSATEMTFYRKNESDNTPKIRGPGAWSKG